jgi:WD40 repeat protein
LAVAVSLDGTTVISADHDGTVKVFDIASGKLLRSLERHEYPVLAVALSLDGKRAASGAMDGGLKIWDLATGKQLCSIPGYQRKVAAVALNLDGSLAASGGADMTVKLWDVATGKLVAAFTADAGVGTVALAANGRRIFAGDTLGRLHRLAVEL